MDKADMDENYTYIVRCADGTLYTGWTNDLKKRIKAHNSGKGAKYTQTCGAGLFRALCHERGGNEQGVSYKTAQARTKAGSDR